MSAAMTKFSKSAIEQELSNITQWWVENTVDRNNGGFVGEIDFFGDVKTNANKGIILNSRILWYFSELTCFKGAESHDGQVALEMAKRAYQYVLNHFDDVNLGGCFWELDAHGHKVDGKKQVYAQCFCIYAFCAFYKATGDKSALDLALKYFDLVETHARDRDRGGYIEALTEDWQAIDDFRLSDKDMNVPKSMNTHLHVLEAYAALYKVHPSEATEEALRHVLDVFEQQIINLENGHLRLFFDLDWRDQSATYSFGHDIEASWLVWEAVEFLNDEALSKKWQPIVVNMAQVCLNEAIGEQGQVCEDFDKATAHKACESYWWVQAEALVGFLNAYHLSGEQGLRDVCDGIWEFIQAYHLDTDKGEWHWLSSNDELEKQKLEYKAGFWKAPYHNGRAMMEVIKLFNKLEAA